MHILITGGAGFIGSHLVELLLNRQHQVTVIDDLSTGKRNNLPTHPHLTFIQESVLTCEVNQLTAEASSYDGLVHLAATPSVAHSWTTPLAAHNNTLSGTLAVIELCQRLKIPRVVFASSAAVYGSCTHVPVSETSPTSPLSPYGLQKLTSEHYLTMFARHSGLSAVNLRMFNVFGPRQDPNSPYSGVISIFAKAMKEGLPVAINGKGEQTRDFVYVKDVVLAFEKALSLPMAAGSCLTCNIGTGKAMSVLQLKRSLQKCFPTWQGKTDFFPPRPGDIQDSQADISRAQQYLAFAPQFSVQEGLMALKESLDNSPEEDLSKRFLQKETVRSSAGSSEGRIDKSAAD